MEPAIAFPALDFSLIQGSFKVIEADSDDSRSKAQSMSQEFNVVIEKDADGYYVASVPSLQGCHTQAKSLDELIERIQEAIALCLEFEEDINEPLEFIGIQKVAVTL